MKKLPNSILFSAVFALGLGIFPLVSREQSAPDTHEFCSPLPIVIAKPPRPFPKIPNHALSAEEKNQLKAAVDGIELEVYDKPLGDKGYCISTNTLPHKILASMHYRGSSSLTALKHQYKVKLEEKPTEPFLGMKEGGKSWIFSADSPNLDGTYLRSPLSFFLQRKLGELSLATNKAWAPNTRHFEFFLQQPDKPFDITVDYLGLYTVVEPITLKKISHQPNNAPVILYKLDNVDPGDLTVEDESGKKFIVDSFDNIEANLASDSANSAEKTALPSFWNMAMRSWINSLQSGKTEIAGGYQFLTDSDSFAIVFLLNELIKDPDGYEKSTFLYQIKEQEKVFKMYAGPLWDKNLGYGLDLPLTSFAITGGYEISKDKPYYKSPEGWTFPVKSPFWRNVFMQEPVRNKICIIWTLALKNNVFTEVLTNYIDEEVAVLTKPNPNQDPNASTATAILRDCKQQNYNPMICGKEFTDKVAALKEFIKKRVEFMKQPDQLGDTEAICQQNIVRILQSN